MNMEKAARRSCSYRRAKASGRDADIIRQNWERGTRWAGIAVAVCFGLMFLWAGAMW